MLRSTVLVTATILPLLAATSAFALPPGYTTTGRCHCLCSVPGGNFEGGIYNKIGGSCLVYNGRTCNIEDPATGGVRSGKLEDCGDEIAVDGSTVQHGLTLDPGSASTPQQRLQVAPGLERLTPSR